MREIFNGKRIIIVGPATNQPRDKFLNNFDYVIRTNNFINSSISNKRCDMLLLNNVTSKAMDNKTATKINRSKIKFIICYSNHFRKMKRLFPNKRIIRISRQKDVKVGPFHLNFKKNPTIIYVFMINLLKSRSRFRNIFFDGIDFYMRGKRYVRGYSWLIHRIEKGGTHNIHQDRKFLSLLLRVFRNIGTTPLIKRIAFM